MPILSTKMVKLRIYFGLFHKILLVFYLGIPRQQRARVCPFPPSYRWIALLDVQYVKKVKNCDFEFNQSGHSDEHWALSSSTIRLHRIFRSKVDWKTKWGHSGWRSENFSLGLLWDQNLVGIQITTSYKKYWNYQFKFFSISILPLQNRSCGIFSVFFLCFLRCFFSLPQVFIFFVLLFFHFFFFLI